MSDAEPEGFLRRYVFSTDHKVIARQYMLTGLIMALVGGAAASLIRAQLAAVEPGGTGGLIDPQLYNGIVTFHGTLMVFWVAMPLLVAGFGNLLIPLMCGTDDMAFPRLNMLSYWIFFLSTVVLLASLFVPGGTAAGGWTSYPPLASRPDYSGVNWGITLWILAVALEFVAFLMGGVNFITTAINKRAPGMSMWDLPLFVWEEVAASIVFMLSVGPLIAGAVMLLLDHTAGTAFFDPTRGGDPVLFQHLFWFFGHPEVYVILFPAMGIAAEVITAHARKTLFGYRMIVWSVIATALLSFVVWAHHQFIAGIDPRVATPFSITTILISVPVAVTIFGLIGTLYQGSVRFTSAMLFGIGFLAMFLLGGVTGIINGAAATDIYIHDSYYVVAHFHYTLYPLVFLAGSAGVYHWFPKLFGRLMDEKLGLVHFLGTMVFFNLTFLPQFNLGLMGHHRRIAVPTAYEFLSSDTALWLQDLSTIGAAGLLAAQVPFIWNFFWSMFRGAEAGANPWRTTTLEWQCPSPPPHGNFETPPICHRGPYEYSPPDTDDDFLPQNLPPAARPAAAK
jgi:cytochrome c oxidase subunit 1